MKHIYEVAQKSGGNNFIIRKSEVLKEGSQDKMDEVIFSLPEHTDDK